MKINKLLFSTDSNTRITVDTFINRNESNFPISVQRNDSEQRIALSLPGDCRDSTEDCFLFVGIDTNREDRSYLDFTVEGKAGGWVAAGFSKTPDMVTILFC